MISRSASLRALFLLPLLLGIVACEETPLEPNLGSGNLLKATIDGEAITFDFESFLSGYDAEFDVGTIYGANSTVPIKSISLTFRDVDLDNDEFPKTLTGASCTIQLVTTDELGDDLEYRTPSDITQSNTTITITGTDGTIVDGTFRGTLRETDDPNDRIQVTNGTFSARLERE